VKTTCEYLKSVLRLLLLHQLQFLHLQLLLLLHQLFHRPTLSSMKSPSKTIKLLGTSSSSLVLVRFLGAVSVGSAGLFVVFEEPAEAIMVLQTIAKAIVGATGGTAWGVGVTEGADRVENR
jgi:hypothetical protein